MDEPGPWSPSATGASALDSMDYQTAGYEPMISDATVAAIATARDGTVHDDDEEANMNSSDMDVSSSGPSSSTQLKRKHSRSTDAADISPVVQTALTKKQRLEYSGATVKAPVAANDLPVQIWQHIFKKLSPAEMGRCLSVSKLFNYCLTGVQNGPLPRNLPRAIVPLTLSNDMWEKARQNYFPKLPRPLRGYPELKMIQLVGNERCQFCFAEPDNSNASVDPIQRGPGPKGVNVIWPLAIRACGNCFEAKTIKDLDLLQTDTGFLVAGLPYALRSRANHYVPETLRQKHGNRLNNYGLSKVHYEVDVQDMADAYEGHQGYGPGAVQEWRKGLPKTGKDMMAEAAKWENWQIQLRAISPAEALKVYDPDSFPRFREAKRSKSTGPVYPPNGTAHGLPAPVHVFDDTRKEVQRMSSQDVVPTPTPYGGFADMRVEVQRMRSEDVAQFREARKLEIQRRSAKLVPPIYPEVLEKMEAFRTTMVIGKLMDDEQWERLCPLLIAQREAAEVKHEREEQKRHQEEHERAVWAATITPDGSHITYLKPSRELYPDNYQEKQQALRIQLGEWVDDYMWSKWRGPPRNPDPNTSAIFAADVLVHVYEEYQKDIENGQQHLLPNAPFLSLENMRWVYEKKVHPHLGLVEVFLCTDCVAENAPIKWLAFESLIQHFAAKHTEDFSRDNIVVDWQGAHWPDDPPFVTNLVPFLDGASHNKGSRRPANRPSQNARPTQGIMSEANLDLSQHPQFASKGSRTEISHPPPYIGNSSVQTSPNDWDIKLRQFSDDACQTWNALGGVDELILIDCIRLQTALYHAVTRFVARFRHDPPLDLLSDLLLKDEDFRSLKKAKALACKSCIGVDHAKKAGDGQFYFSRIRDATLYTFASLVTHFSLVHQDQGRINWCANMIELPGPTVIRGLLRAHGMNDIKLALVAIAFPDAFPRPLPRIGDVRALPGTETETNILDRLKGWKGSKKGSKKVKQAAAKTEFPEVGDDEYDPRRPSLDRKHTTCPKKQVPEFDPARFDTDLARERPIKKESGLIGLTPDTMAAVKAVFAGATPSQPVPANGSRQNRSPSVGRAAPQIIPQTSPPDIGAILAALNPAPKPEFPPAAAVPLPMYHTTPPALPQPMYYTAPQAPSPQYDHRWQQVPAVNPYMQYHPAHAYRTPDYPPAAPQQPSQQIVIHQNPDGSNYYIDEWGRRIKLEPIDDKGPVAPSPPSQQPGWHFSQPPAPPGWR